MLFTLLLLTVSTLSQANLLKIAPTSVQAAAWVILDPQTGQTIAAYDSNVRRAPASLTKIMVGHLVLKEIQANRLKAEDLIRVPESVQQVQWDESQMYLKMGDVISVRDLLTGLIVMSANDAAITLAEHIAGSVPKFVAMMNAEAAALGMQNTHFVNTPGITHPDHYSTAYDLALLSQAVVNEQPEFLAYSKLQSFTYQQRYHRATNILLKVDPTVDGLKTGFTKAAKYNLALTAHRPIYDELKLEKLDDRRLIVVVLGAPNASVRAETAHRLMQLAYRYTRNEEVIKPNQPLALLPVLNAQLEVFKLTNANSQKVTTALYPHEEEWIDLNQFDAKTQYITRANATGETEVVMPLTQTKTKVDVEYTQNELIAPLVKAIQFATVSVYQNNHLIRTFNIEQDVEIEEASLFRKVQLWFKSLLNLFTGTQPTLTTFPITDSQ